MSKILMIDNHRGLVEKLSKVLRRLGHEIVTAETVRDGVRRALRGRFDVVLVDRDAAEGDILDALPRLREAAGAPEIIVKSEAGDPDGAERAVRQGAWEYIERSDDIAAIQASLHSALAYREHQRHEAPLEAFQRASIIGESDEMHRCLELASQAARSDVNVLLTGETGTGKELFAYAIHDNSPRAEARLVVVDCAALPETLVESVLFGHVKGAFTGADRAQDGLIKQADGGTLFLDEVGELPWAIQKSFLRVLQEQRFRPVGSKTEQTSRFRLISATNRNLGDMVPRGLFRKDLLYRVQAYTIEIPPLRRRVGDIRDIAQKVVDRLCRHYGIRPKTMSPDFLVTLESYDWPGNVRELENTIEHAVISARRAPTLFLKHLPTPIRIKTARAAARSQIAPQGAGPKRVSRAYPKLRDIRRDAAAAAEQQYLEGLMAETAWNIPKACRLSGLSRPRLYALLKSRGLSKRG